MIYWWVVSSTTTRQYVLSIFIVAALFFVVFFPSKVFAGNIITILQGTSDRTNPSFFDSSYYFIKLGKTVKWYNTDDVSHKHILTNSRGNSSYAATQQIAESGRIPLNGNYSYKLYTYVVYEYFISELSRDVGAFHCLVTPTLP